MRSSLFPVFGDIFDEFEKTIATKSKSVYPPYNVIKVEDGKYEIEIATTGFDKDDLKVYVENGNLVIEGKHSDKKERDDKDYVYRHLSKRNFVTKFYIGDMEVENVENKNGVMTVTVKNKEPEKKYLEIK